MLKQTNITLKVASVICAIALFFATVGASFFIAKEADHLCDGEKCNTCYQIAVAKSIQKTACVAAVACAAVATFIYSRCKKIDLFDCFLSHITPVTLRVKLSN